MRYRIAIATPTRMRIIHHHSAGSALLPAAVAGDSPGVVCASAGAATIAGTNSRAARAIADDVATLWMARTGVSKRAWGMGRLRARPRRRINKRQLAQFL